MMRPADASRSTRPYRSAAVVAASAAIARAARTTTTAACRRPRAAYVAPAQPTTSVTPSAGKYGSVPTVPASNGSTANRADARSAVPYGAGSRRIPSQATTVTAACAVANPGAVAFGRKASAASATGHGQTRRPRGSVAVRIDTGALC
jgi:hypothetical protein